MDRAFRIYLWLAFGITWGAGGLGLLAGAFDAAGPQSTRSLVVGGGGLRSAAPMLCQDSTRSGTSSSAGHDP